VRGNVAPDGSPVDIYLALPPGDTPALIDSAIGPRSSILELGSGPGRITHPLVELGHDVVAVDNSEEMLEQVRVAETVLADVFDLSLGRRFDVVVAGSHLINAPERARRLGLLEVCRRHMKPDGVALVERYAPDWAVAPAPSEGSVGEVHISFEPIQVDEEGFSARVTYKLGEAEWTQVFSAAAVTDETLHDEAAAAGLRLTGWLDEARTWGLLRPEV
jgi:SAM-dependent methyltransferase